MPVYIFTPRVYLPATYIMRASSVSAILLGAIGFAAADRFLINYDDGKYQACFVDGHDWWFCGKFHEGEWRSQNYLTQIGCGYYYQISEAGVVTTTSNNGCGYKAHCSLAWNADTGKVECDLKTDHPNC
ncbi:hypothetical protein BCR34DRAFT_180348 [Clohesyomyces aquaticus]|uniref:Uncharacterized protein n=1 Tax=Clohesyomyces aquaticus TaxID=1231657 RepID=A0A1Y1YEX9_9PLEO|nr:hypothetical protein BCR34DRAFT_180348 [Clohesyomyces aquaticus]